MTIKDFVSRMSPGRRRAQEDSLRCGPELPIQMAHVQLNFIIDNIEDPNALRRFGEMFNDLMFETAKTPHGAIVLRKPGFAPINDMFGTITVLDPYDAQMMKIYGLEPKKREQE